MKLEQLKEAKYHRPSKVAVHEIIGGRYGEIDHFKSVTTMEDLVKYIEAAAIEAAANEDDDTLEDMDDMPWSIGAVMYNYKPQEILGALKKKQGWAGNHEEGVVGISTKGPAHAKMLASNEWAGGEDDDDEDWY
ncbi:MAG: hypothetical protein ACXADH_11065 [Candidatus Kariarchaeaceae archaeon]|jgi:hypothetical protein